ncbi:MAG: AmmeMemoRadiSam system protein B [bacterium]
MAKIGLRRAVSAGIRSFYPADPDELRKMLRQFSANTRRKVTGKVTALIAPHAAYLYGGQTAAWAYRQLDGTKYDRVAILAPSHYATFPGASIFEGSAYETPLGQVELDTDGITRLRKQNPWIDYYYEAEAREHSIEAQLPFLQYFLKNFLLIPILMHDQGYANCERLAGALEKEMTSNRMTTLIVASSDIYHGPCYERARAMNQRVAGLIQKMDPKAFHASAEKGKIQACGYGPITAAMMLAGRFGATGAQIHDLTTSHDVYPMSENFVVGYLSAALSM